MRNLLILVFLCFTLTLSGVTYYIDPSGSNSNNGSSGAPWLTLAYACSHTTSGDIIHINAGTYNESSQCVLALGVSIEGAAGAVPIINLSWTGNEHNGAIKMVSGRTNPLSNGNHTISYLDLRGTTGVTGITCEYQNNVTIHHCSFSNFGVYGLYFYNASSIDWWYPPAVHMTGHSVYNCTFTNVENWLGGSSGFLFHDNVCDNSSSTAKCLSSDHMKGWKIYNCSFSKAFSITGWNFIFETYRYSDECEIYNNVFNNCAYSLDISDVRNGSGTYGLKIRNNQFIRSAIGPINTEHGCYTINVEGWGAIQGLEICNNYFKNLASGISVGSTNQHYNIYPDGSHWALDHIYIAYNIFENLGCTNVQSSVALWFWEDVASGYSLNQVYDNIFVCNNVFSTTTTASYALQNCFKTYWTQPVTNFHFDNNIIQNFTWIGEYFINSSNFSGVSIQKNLHFNNASNSITFGTGTPSGTINNLTPSNPLFVSSTDFHLQSGSPAIGKGIPVAGLTTDYSGNAVKNPPSVGAFEYGSTPTTPVIPLYLSSEIQNSTPSLVEMTYDVSLNNSIVPSASSFSVLVNSVVRAINSVAVSAAKVQLTLASPVVYGDVVTIAYSKPAVNPLQTTSGVQAATISAQTVANKVASLNLVYVSSAIENSTPSSLEMTYNLALANIVPGTSAFSVSVNALARTVSSVTISGSKVKLVLASRIVAGDNVSVSYTKPATNPLQTSTGGTAASLINQPVANNCINSAPSASIASPSNNSSFSAPANISIAANASDTDGSVSMVEFYNGTTKIGSKSAAPYSFEWTNVTQGTYLLTVVATDNLNAKTTSQAVSISVNIPGVNLPPVVTISNPKKGNKYEKLSTITIDAVASDPDGAVSKVEFYNGTVKLVEITSAPFSYTWKDVKPGSYTITAKATDNLNATTTSLPIEFQVGSTVKYDANSEIIKLYPNPNNGRFSIEFINPLQNDKSVIIITDMAGKQIFNGPVLKEETTKQFDLTDSRSGIYVMMIKDKDILVTKKFIKN